MLNIKTSKVFIPILRFLVFSYTIVFYQNTDAQIESSGISFNTLLKSASLVPEIKVDTTGIKGYIHEVNQQRLTDQKVIKIAKHIKVDINSVEDGVWTEFQDMKIWRIKIKADGAKSLGILFKKYKLPLGAKLFVYNNNEEKGAFTSLNNKPGGTLFVSALRGDFAQIELQLPKDVTFEYLQIESITYGFLKDIYAIDALKSQYCNVDVNCFEYSEPIQRIKNSVVKIIANGTDICTGTLINNTANDGKAYVITANHCISTNQSANNTVFYFNFEASYCNGPYETTYNTLSYSTLVATKQSLDFTLLEMSILPPYHYSPYYSGWDIDNANILNTIAVHHPDGDIKKISKDNDPPAIGSYDTFDSQAFYRILKWDMGTTEGGSSGGSLFDNNYKIIGTLTGGQANCDNSVNDYYARLDRAWDDYEPVANQLKHWLDPGDSNVLTINGYDPYAEVKLHNYTVQNISYATEDLILKKLVTWGYLSGHNPDNLNFAEKFVLDKEVSLIGFYFNVAKAKKESSIGRIKVQVWQGDLSEESEIYSRYYVIDHFQENKYNYIPLDDFYKVSGDLYIGYELYNVGVQDTFALYMAAPRIDNNTAFVYQFGVGWIPLFESINESSATSLDIKPVFNDPDYTVNESKIIDQDDVFYPNPCSDKLYISFRDNGPKSIEIYSVNGVKVYDETVINFSSHYEIDVTCLNSGLYFLRIFNESEAKIYKFIVNQ